MSEKHKSTAHQKIVESLSTAIEEGVDWQGLIELPLHDSGVRRGRQKDCVGFIVDQVPLSLLLL